jgi:hypothetical protein
MIYTHVLNRGGLAVRSPLDQVAAADHVVSAANPATFQQPCPARYVFRLAQTKESLGPPTQPHHHEARLPP